MRGLLVFRHRSFSLLWIAGLVSMTGDWLLGVALPVYVFKLTGSAAATSAVLAVSVTAALVAGAVAGVLVDRWDRRRVMILANLLQVGAILPLLAVNSADRVWIVLLVAAAESSLGQFVAPAEQALLPRLVSEEELGAANSLNTLNRSIARLGGPALGAIVAVSLGLAGAATLDAASFAIAAGLVALIGGGFRAVSAGDSPADDTIAAPAVEGPLPAVVPAAAGTAPAPVLVLADPSVGRPGSDGGRSDAPVDRTRLPRADRVSAVARWWFELGQGLAAIWASRVVRALFLVIGVTAVGEGIMGSLFVVFAARGLSGGSNSIGWLMSAQAVGGIIGGLLAAGLASRLRPVPTVVTAFTLFGLIDTVIFNLPRYTPALSPQLVLFALVGIPGAVGIAAAMTLLQSEIGDALRGRVFAAFSVVQAGAALLGASIAASLTERLGVIVVLTVQGLGYIVAAIAFGLLVRPPRPRRRGVRLPASGPCATAGMAGLQRQFNG